MSSTYEALAICLIPAACVLHTMWFRSERDGHVFLCTAPSSHERIPGVTLDEAFTRSPQRE
jgi:hypothetical protein